ncbi:hypothetical protein B0H16DRAFT_1879594 [Mycena metata]|uniref:Uncharacterized protein n=1 Tax=Mycena metata TaxID=1033252 RepID=A0AAD7NUX3_9AGAR|nr:hypothetical protein B0H16DRAFT_1879594 [Mycena metata]
MFPPPSLPSALSPPVTARCATHPPRVAIGAFPSRLCPNASRLGSMISNAEARGRCSRIKFLGNDTAPTFF